MKYTILVLSALLTLLAAQTASAQWQERRPGQGNGYPQQQQQYGSGQLYSSQVDCRYGQLCSTNIGWRVYNQYAQGLVTVTVPDGDGTERSERIMSCGVDGNTFVPWIKPGHTYVFKLYVSNSCSYIPYGSPVVDTVTIRR